MPLAARFSLLHSDLNDFLFASLGDEQNGMTLNVISALTRLGIDPWEEAARLAALPKVQAAEALAILIARLPVARPLASDNLAISDHLVQLLPIGRQATSSEQKRRLADDKKYLLVMLLLACFAFGMAVMTAIF
jgi:hypothetical protein